MRGPIILISQIRLLSKTISNKRTEYEKILFFFSHPDYTVGSRLTLDPPQNAGHGLQLLVVTVGRELHPAPKKSLFSFQKNDITAKL